MNNPQYLAQVGHFLGGVSVMLLSLVATLVWADGALEPCVYAFFGGLLAAAIKEFWYDLRYELPKQTIDDSAMDFSFYALGGVAGGAVCAFALAHIHLATP